MQLQLAKVTGPTNVISRVRMKTHVTSQETKGPTFSQAGVVVGLWLNVLHHILL